jgi:hypothetical protein
MEWWDNGLTMEISCCKMSSGCRRKYQKLSFIEVKICSFYRNLDFGKARKCNNFRDSCHSLKWYKFCI